MMITRSSRMKYFKTIFVAALLSCNFAGKAQQFDWQARIKPVSNSGFYHIMLTPDVVSKMQHDDMADLRIFDGKHEIPYLLTNCSDNYLPGPAPKIKIIYAKSDKETSIRLDFDQEYAISQLKLEISAPEFYRRDAFISVAEPKDKSKRNNYFNPINFSISSDTETLIKLDAEKRHKQYFIVISNEDNPPLTIKNVIAYQQKTYLTAHFDKNTNYLLKVGTEAISIPKYDLNYFRDSINFSTFFTNVEKFERNTTNIANKNTIFNDRSWIWGTLIVIMALLGYISYRLIGDMKKDKTSI